MCIFHIQYISIQTLDLYLVKRKIVFPLNHILVFKLNLNHLKLSEFHFFTVTAAFLRLGSHTGWRPPRWAASMLGSPLRRQLLHKHRPRPQAPSLLRISGPLGAMGTSLQF